MSRSAAGMDAKPKSLSASTPEIVSSIFSFLDGVDLAQARQVCKKWDELASSETLWKALCLTQRKSLETDKHLWHLIAPNVVIDSPDGWKEVLPLIKDVPKWNCRLEKTGEFACDIIAHEIEGPDVDVSALPTVLSLRRGFLFQPLEYCSFYVQRDAAVLYFEPKLEADRAGITAFIDRLSNRKKAGLVEKGRLRFLFIPPCAYARDKVGYFGQNLIGFIQNPHHHFTPNEPLAP